jgi:hypothetical protein
MKSIDDRIKAAFDEYRATAALLDGFVQARQHAQELVILVCSRLDALANLAMTQKKSQRDRFVSFLHAYSGRPAELARVLLPNLYFDIFVKFVTLPVTIPVPGRLCSYDMSRDASFLQFIVDSGVPLTSEDVSKWLHRLSVWLQRKYRTTVTQSKSKPYYDDVRGVTRHLEACSRVYRKGTYALAVAALSPILNNFRLADVLYRDYRSRSIHEFAFNTDEQFFTERGVYVATRFHAWDSTRFLEVCVSAHWLVDLYRETVGRYERSLLARRKLPIDLWTELCDTSREFAFLDDSSVPVGRDLRIRVER